MGLNTACRVRCFQILNVVDCFSREALAAEVDTILSDHCIVGGLQRLLEKRGKIDVNQVDNGSEFTVVALDERAHQNHTKLHFLESGKPAPDDVIEN